MTDQQPSTQPQFTLAEGERLLAAYKAAKDDGGRAGAAWGNWLLWGNGEALVTALRDFQSLHCTCKFNAEWPEQPDDLAVQWAFEECPYHTQIRNALKEVQQDAGKRTEYFNRLHRRFLDVIGERTQLRADLARAEDIQLERGAAIYGIGGYVQQVERLQARIAELEAQLPTQ